MSDPLRHTPGSTSPKIGRVPPAGVAGQAALSNSSQVAAEPGRGIVPNMSSTRIVSSIDRRRQQQEEAS